jgi:trk system potassium uptake protein TrkH
MLIFGVNFNLYYLILIRKFKSVLKSLELKVFFIIVLTSVVLITINILPLYNNISEAIRHSAFQTASIISTTGYSTVDFDKWPEFAKSILLILMFIGGCAGSTAGGFKVSRIIMLFKQLRNEFKRMLHPRSVSVVKLEEKKVDTPTISGVSIYLFIYVISILFIFLLLSLEKFGFTTNFSAAVSCFNNIGPGFEAIGPMVSYADYSDFSKILLSFAMLLGRLEIFPILIALSPATWSKK